MHWPVLFKKYSIAVLFCGLLTITRAIDTSREAINIGSQASQQYKQKPPPPSPTRQQQHHPPSSASPSSSQHAHGEGLVPRNSYAMLSQAISQAVNHEFSK